MSGRKRNLTVVRPNIPWWKLRPRFDGRPVFLLRSHKTAGQSFSLGLRAAFRPDEISPHYFTWQYGQLGPDDLTQYRYLSGHVGRPTVARVSPDARLLTILRSPVDRLISSYFFWRSQVTRFPDTDHHDVALRLQSMTLLDFVKSEDPVIRRAAWNVQARLLAGADYGLAPAKRTQLFGFEEDVDAVIGRAMEGFEDFAVIGTVDRFEDSVRAAYRVLDLPGEPKFEFNNRTPSKFKDQGVTDEILEYARRMTEADQVVYDAANARLSELTSTEGNQGPGRSG
jgi:hypothetical protein